MDMECLVVYWSRYRRGDALRSEGTTKPMAADMMVMVNLDETGSIHVIGAHQEMG